VFGGFVFVVVFWLHSWRPVLGVWPVFVMPVLVSALVELF
jgi:hypothetical protein